MLWFAAGGLAPAVAGDVPPVLQCQNDRLNAPLGADEEIAGFQVALDGTKRVVFLADVVLDGEFDALTVPQDGSAPPTLFDIDRIPGRFLNGLPQIAPATERAVIVGDFETLDVDELFSVTTATGGGPLTKLNAQLVDSGDVRSFAISADGETVVYLADQEANGREELYRVSVNGGEVTKLNAPLEFERDVDRDFVISSDDRYVVFQADKGVFERDLFSAELATGTLAQLNTNPDNRGDAFRFQVSADSTTVVYQANQENNSIFELFQVPVSGGTPRKLNGPEVEQDVREFMISPDSSTVVYLVSRASGNTFVPQLYSVPLSGGAPVHLTAAASIDTVDSFELTPDGAWVLIEAQIGSGREILSVPIAGGSVERVSGDPAQIGITNGFVVSPDGQSIVYRARRSGVPTLRIASLQGSVDRALTGPSVANGNFEQLEITLDNEQLLFTADYLIAGQQELFAVALGTPGPVRRINKPLPVGAAVRSSVGDDFQQTLDGQRVVYLADENTVGIKELFSTDIRCDDVFADGFEADSR